jgi:hypothetical protein
MAIGTVITADIVNSSFLSKQLLTKLLRTVESLIKPNKYEFYRGDSFQVYVKDSAIALELCLKIRLAARRIEASKEIDVRAAIGISLINRPVRALRISSEKPFVLSGRALDDLSRTGNRLRIVSSNDNADDIFRITARFIDFIFKGLTSKQSAVIFELLMGSTQTEAAKKLKKSQVTVNRHVHAASWMEINQLLLDYKNAIHKYNLK